MTEAEPLSNALRHGNFVRFLAGITAPNAAQFLLGIAVPIAMLDLVDGSPRENTWIGAAGFAQLIPAVLCTPIAGTLADRVDRKRVLVASYVVSGAIAGALLVMHTTDRLTPWWIIALQLVGGIGAGFTFATVQSMSPVLVPPEDLVPAVRCVSISFTAGRAAGPLLGGLLVWLSGPGLGFAVAAGLYVFGFAMNQTVRQRPYESASPEPFVSQLREGFGYVFARPSMRVAIWISFVAAFCAAPWPFALASSVGVNGFDIDEGAVGLIAGLFGIGSAVASIVFVASADRFRRSTLELVAMGFFVGGLLIVISTTSFVVALCGFFVMGCGHMVHGVTVSTSLQVQVEERFRGRAMSVWLVSVLLGVPMGAIVGGALADATSVRAAMTLFTAVLIVSVLGISLRNDRLRGLDLQESTPPA